MERMKMRRWLRLSLLTVAVLLVTVLIARLLLPNPLFKDPFSIVVFDRNHQLLGAGIASDGQWRFPESDSLPVKYRKALLQFEDRHFYHHLGFNPVSAFHALMANLKARRVVRGGSTLTMQLIRLSRKGQPRNIFEKIKEILLAVAAETKYSKKQILQLYASHAPFGGNVVGLEAASWRYFGRNPNSLSWAETAMLAVLPNTPSYIYPGKNRRLLLNKRNRLLKQLYLLGDMDSTTYCLSLLEKIPDKPHKLPDQAYQLKQYFRKKGVGSRFISTIDGNIQKRVNQIVAENYKKYRQNEIKNLAVLVVDPSTRQVLAYVGNAPGRGIEGHDNDMIQVPRSTGSILKPFLYAGAIEDGQIMINSLIPDIPSYFKNYHPQNFDQHFEGAVPASLALSRSRNVPAIYLLRDYGIGRFMDLMKHMGLTTFNRSSDNYGLSLILGGGEATLWELTGAYVGMAQTLLHYDRFYGKYTGKEYDGLIVNALYKINEKEPNITASLPLDAGAIWETYQALYQVHRPEMEEGWEYFSSTVPVAWKTGTSFGFKDAWAIGSTPEYIVGVWVGNADGEGRSDMTGSAYAAPVMFEVFESLHITKRFIRPEDDLKEVIVCKQSGYRASRYCTETDTILSYIRSDRVKICPFHKPIFTDANERYRLSQRCASVSEMKKVSWFVLPSVQEWYYHQSHPSYKTLPPYKPGCALVDEQHVMSFIYPRPGIKVFVPRGPDGKLQKVIFQVSHRNPNITLYWNLDNQFIGFTQNDHKLAFVPDTGKHKLTVIDQNGVSISIWFEVVN
ncbi:MAG: penicillin-binding protein 1C [Bacteroidales bacterium]|nr:penicillin-binding protein 1C [Bacteroidales bacterium]